MGKKNWFGAVKGVFSSEHKEKETVEQKSPASKQKWVFCKSKPVDTPTASAHEASDIPYGVPSPSPPSPPPPPTPPLVGVKPADDEQEPNKDVYSAAIATAEAAAAAAKAAADVVRLTTSVARLSNKSKEVAAIKIQAALRGYLARRALRSLRGLARLKSVMHDDAVRRQSTSALHCMQTVTRVKSEIRSRRIKMTEENLALRKQLQLKHERELEVTRAAMGYVWDDSLQSKEQIEASIVNKYEATIRRERALAYAFSHQWRSSTRSVTPVFSDPTNPLWGWSWMERWIAAMPWEGQHVVEKESGNDKTSSRSVNFSIGGEMFKAYGQQDAVGERPSPMARKSIRLGSHQSPSTLHSKTSSVTRGKIRSASPRAGRYPSEDDTRSLFSIASEKNRRHSVAGSSVRDDESLASSPSIPNYTASTESSRAKSCFPSPSSVNNISDGASTSSAKKRLSFPTPTKPHRLSPAGAGRHSGPPKSDGSSVKDIHDLPVPIDSNGSIR